MNWKLISTGAAGVVVGALAGAAGTAAYFKKKQEALSADLNDTAVALSEKSQQVRTLQSEIESLKTPPVSEQVEELNSGGEIEEVQDPEDPNLDERNEEVKRNLQELIAPYVSGEEPIEDFVRQAKRIKVHRGAPPEVISQQLYAWDPDGPGDEYEKTTLTYYPRHRILLDEDKDLIESPNVEAMVGWRSLNQFGNESNDPNIVFVRNHHLATDFEIEKIEDEDPPLHVRFGMPRQEFEMQKAAGTLVFREDDV